MGEETVGSIGHDSVFVQCMSDREEAPAGGSAMVHDSHTHNGLAGGAATGRAGVGRIPLGRVPYAAAKRAMGTVTRGQQQGSPGGLV